MKFVDRSFLSVSIQVSIDTNTFLSTISSYSPLVHHRLQTHLHRSLHQLILLLQLLVLVDDVDREPLEVVHEHLPNLLSQFGAVKLTLLDVVDRLVQFDNVLPDLVGEDVGVVLAAQPTETDQNREIREILVVVHQVGQNGQKMIHRLVVRQGVHRDQFSEESKVDAELRRILVQRIFLQHLEPFIVQGRGKVRIALMQQRADLNRRPHVAHLQFSFGERRGHFGYVAS